MGGDVDVHDAPSVVGQDDGDEQGAESRRGNGEEVDRGQLSDVTGEEGPPFLGRRRSALGCEVFRDRGLSDRDAWFPELAVNARQEHPEQAIGATEMWTLRGVALKDGQLMPQGENLRLELETRLDGGPKGGEQRDEQGGHLAGERYQPPAETFKRDNTFRLLG
jgi:hypothetical protein